MIREKSKGQYFVTYEDYMKFRFQRFIMYIFSVVAVTLQQLNGIVEMETLRHTKLKNVNPLAPYKEILLISTLCHCFHYYPYFIDGEMGAESISLAIALCADGELDIRHVRHQSPC